MRLPVAGQRSEEPWYAEGLSFQCTQCGNCCTGPPGYVWLSRDELKVLADHLKLTERETVRQHCRLINGRLSLKERRVARGKFDCVFLKDLPGGKKGCGIYHVRPLQCRTWPFWDGNLQDEAAWREAGTTCPGLNRGKHFTSDDIEALRDADAWPEESPSSSYGDDASANETAHEHQRR